MAYDYSVLFRSGDGVSDTWREIYDDNIPLSWNLLNILKKTIYLPYDFYDIIAAYFLLPSALCRIVPYLFLYGQSGSGKSTIAKVASYLHGVTINSSSDTFAGIRNSLNERRYTWVEVPPVNENELGHTKTVELNTCMVWDDISASTFTLSPDLYNMFKFGYDKTTDKIVLSGKETGTNLEFHCFCPKVFSSISPLHLDERFRELKRRLIVIPCKRVEELSDERRAELGITVNDWQLGLLDLTTYDWKGFSALFDSFWDIDTAEEFVVTRKLLSKSIKGISSQQRVVSLDLMATGIAAGVWEDEEIALERIKAYWEWFKVETSKNEGISSLLKTYINQEAKNAKNGDRPLEIYTPQLRSQVDIWVQQGWLYEKPRPKDIKALMLDLGMRHQQGKWVKG